MNKDSILIFGGGVLQLSIIERAKAMGFVTIVIDPDVHSLAKSKSDVFIEVAGKDFEKTMLIAKHYNVKGLVTTATDNPILMMCRIAKEMNLHFPDYYSCETLLDKGKFKQFLAKNNFPHAAGYVFNKVDEVNPEKFNFPVIVKPVISSGSRGVIKCDFFEELPKTVKKTLQFCKDGRFIIEEYLEGDEISVEAFVLNRKVHVIQITDKIVTPPPFNVEIGHIQPSQYIYLKNKIRDLLQEIIDGTSLDNCAIHPEFKIKNDKIIIIEIGPRLGGDYITSHLTPLSTGVNIENIVLQIAIGNKVKYYKENKSALISYLNFPADMEIKSILTENELKQRFPCVKEFQMMLTIGEKVKPITNSLNRHGYFILQGDDLERLKRKREEIEQYLINSMI